MRKSLLLLVLVFCCANILARTAVHSFLHISRKDGLSSDDVYDIVQDHKGFYWVATDNGLQRFDGSRWVRTVFGDPESLPSKPVHQLVLLDHTHLLVKLGDIYGIFNTANFKFKRINNPLAANWNAESTLLKDSRNNVFLLYKGRGILHFNKPMNSFEDAATFFKLPEGTKPYSLFEDQQKDHYWIGTDKGVVVFDNKSHIIYSKGNNPLQLPFVDDIYPFVSSLFIDKARNHWMVYGQSQQVFTAFNEKKGFVEEVSRLPSFYKGKFRIDNIFQTVEEEMWLFGRSALFNYAPIEKSFYNNKSDIVKNFGARFSNVRRILQDREKGIWIATDEGLYQTYTVLPEVRNVVFFTENDDYNISDIQELTTGDLWISSRGKGVLPTDSNHRRLKVDYLYKGVDTLSNRSLKLANTIHQHTPTGKVWVGCDEGYALLINSEKKHTEVLRPEPLAGSAITDIVEDAAGNLWFGSASGMIVKYDHRRNTFNRMLVVESAVRKLMLDAGQRLWICTEEEGLICYDLQQQKKIHHLHKDGKPGSRLSSNKVKTIVQLNDSTYAIATDVFELLNTATMRLTTITYEQGLLGNTILGMQKDRQGHLWLATSNGICRYNHSRKKFTVYEEKDGFMKFETVGTSATMLSNGKIFFGASNAFVTFPPHLFNIQEPPPSVILTDFKVLNSFIPLDSNSRQLEFSHDNNSMNFYFSAMSYLQKDKLTYFYRLKGIDNEWVTSDAQHAAIYTLLPSGDFVFEVRCENENGISSPVTSFAFTINPPFWKTWWFILLVLSALALVLFLFHRSKVNRIIALSDLRNRVARDLHDDVGSTLSTISILSTIAKGKLVDNPVQAEQYISKITDNSQQMMDAMDDIVWSIKPMNDSMQKIVARMREFASGALESKNIDIDFFVDERVLELKLNMESRRDLFLIFKEAVNNTAKYSQATNVSIHFSYIKQRLMLKIKDNGIGFDVATADSGNGISNMKKRAAMLNGRIRWYSDGGKGTCVVLNIPVNA